MKFRFLIFLLLFSSPVYSQNSYDSLVKKGANLLYNFQVAEGNRILNQAIEMAPSQPDAYVFIAQYHAWLFGASKNENEKKNFEKWSDIAISKTESALKKNENDCRLICIIGNIYLLKAVVAETDGSPIKAFNYCKTANSYFENSKEINPKYFDADKGLGLIHYFLDFVPGVFKWAVKLTGMKPDKELGLNLVRKAYREGTDDKIESAFHLSKIFTDYVAEYDSAKVILKNLLTQYPKNPLFCYEMVIAQIKDGNVDDALKYVDRILEKKYPDIPLMNSLTVFLKGDIYFKKNDFKDAEACYIEFISNASDPDYTGIASYRLAICQCVEKKKDAFVKSLLTAREGNTDIFEDAFAKRISKAMNGRFFTDDELLIIKSKNDFDCKKYSNVLKNLSSSVWSISDGDQKANGFLLLAESLVYLNRLDEAAKYLDNLDSIKISDAEWITPRALYVRALLNYFKGDRKSAQYFYQKALDKNDYDFSDEIGELLNNLKRKIY